MQKFSLPGIGALSAAILASLCCIGPIALAAIGIAGFGSLGMAFTLFEPYRPYLIGLTALLLGIAFYMTYRKSETACQEGETCVTPRIFRMRKVGLWALTGISGLMLAIPYLPLSGTETDTGSGYTAAFFGQSASHTDSEADTTLAITTLKIEGMT
jgi:mercuric ion transport protein